MGKAPTISAGPASGNDFFSVTEDQVAAGGLIFNVLANDAKKAALYSLDNATVADLLQEDVPGIAEASALGSSIRITSDGKVAYGAGLNGSLIQSLAAGETVTDSFLYAFRQGGNLVWQTVQVTITGTNDAPVARADTGLAIEDSITTGSVALNDSDIDHGAALHFAATGNLPAGFAMAGDGSWSLDGSDPSYKALSSGESINLAVAYTVADEHGASSSATLVLTVVGTNDAPQVSGVVTSAATEDAAPIALDALAQASDVDHGAVLSAVDVPQQLPAGVSYDVATGRFALDPTDAAYQQLADGETTVVTVSYGVSDGTATTPASVSWTITGTNDVPVTTSPAAEVAEGATTSGQLTALDQDHGAALSFAVAGDAPAGFSLAADGSWSFDASGPAYDGLAEGEIRIVEVPFTVTDDHGASASSQLIIAVTGANDAPIAGDFFDTVHEDTVVSGRFRATDPDTHDELTYSLVSPPPPGLTVNPDGTLTWDLTGPATQGLGEGQTGTLTLDWQATDQHGLASTGTWTVTVVGENDRPILQTAPAVLPDGHHDQPYTVSLDDLLTGWVDPDGDLLRVTNLTADHGTVTRNGSGFSTTYTITPEAGYSGPMQLSYRVADNLSETAANLSFTLEAGTDIGGTTSGSVIEARYGSAGTPTTAGTLTITGDDPHFQAVGSPTFSTGGYGKFTVTADGTWQYNLDNFNSTVNGLNSGQTLSDSFVVHAADGTAQQIDILIRGATDWATISVYPNTNDPNNLDSNLGPAGTDNFNAAVIGTSAGEIVTGGSLNQTIDMQGGNDTVYAQGGDDTVYGGAGDDSLFGQAGNDFLNGDIGNDSMYGGSGNDVMFGNDGMDTLRGGSGVDTINGGAGFDVIIGGYNFDQLTGGADVDAFTYNSVFDSGDVILDFQKGVDVIDLRGIDPNSQQAGDQAFAFSADGAAAYSIWLVQNGSNLEIYADTDGFAGTADFMITLQNVTLSTASLPANFLI